MDFFELAKSRWSVRSFKDTPIEEEKLQMAFQDMQQATVDIEQLQNLVVASEQENAQLAAQIAVCNNEIKMLFVQ